MKLTPEAETLYRKQDYSKHPSIAGVEVHDLRRFADEGGSLIELGRLTSGVLVGFEGASLAQINYSTLEPGAVKAFHVHRRQSDIWFVPPEDRILLVLVDVRNASATAGIRMRLLLGGGASRLVKIPAGVAHGCRNLASTPGRIVYFTDLHFSPDPAETDEGRLPWDTFGTEIWEACRE